MEHNIPTVVWSVVVASELRVVGYDPEYADMDHPRGEIVRDRFYLQATNERGDRRRYGCFETEADAECNFWHLAPPVEEWNEDYPEYGSIAYQEYGDDMDREAERRMEDAMEHRCYDDYGIYW